MSRFTSFSLGKISFEDSGPCKRFDIFQLSKVPLAFLQQHRRRVEYLQVEHRGVGGEEERKLSFLQKSDSNQFVSCGLAEKSMYQFSAKLKRKKIICKKVKVESLFSNSS